MTKNRKQIYGMNKTVTYLSWWGGNHCMFFFTLPLFVCIDLCYLNWCNQIRNPTWLLLQRVAKLVIGQGLFSQVRVLLTRSTACFDLISHTLYFLHEIGNVDGNLEITKGNQCKASQHWDTDTMHRSICKTLQ